MSPAKKQAARSRRKLPSSASPSSASLPIPAASPISSSIARAAVVCFSRASDALARIASSKWVSSPLRLFVLLSTIMLAAMLILAAILPPPEVGLEVSEAPLEKNAPLMLLAGEEYVYNVSVGGQWHIRKIAVARVKFCPGILMYDKAYAHLEDTSLFSVCLGSGGVEIGADGSKIGTNLTYANVSWPYFYPWMLAISEGWNWEATTALKSRDFVSSDRQKVAFRTNGIANFSGRQAWNVSMWVQAGGGPETLAGEYLIDAQKRVMLSYTSGATSARCISAPFELAD